MEANAARLGFDPEEMYSNSETGPNGIAGRYTQAQVKHGDISEYSGFIERMPGQARSIRMLISHGELPDLE
jgi:hypothetical protein